MLIEHNGATLHAAALINLCADVVNWTDWPNQFVTGSPSCVLPLWCRVKAATDSTLPYVSAGPPHLILLAPRPGLLLLHSVDYTVDSG